MNFVNFFTGNLILNLAILAWAVAQILKFIVVMITEGRMNWRYMLSSGGMPSSHSSFVCACASSVAYLYGWSSPLFAIATVVAVVVMYDASNVRRAAGEQAKVLNYIMGHWTQMKPEMFGQELKELLGHTPLQVLMGALLGTGMGWGGAWFFTR
ncbi:MAG: divergent PAP2 family protein [Pseudoflavonifractor sp.]|nr:divergent PAP2 family protein [Pseudoflavonifractor sp.]